jgi:hypothetical protein
LVDTEKIACDISVVFVPIVEIAKALHKYRNSILRFNPRSYLELAHNVVNKEIERSVIQFTKNEFALYNNGITMLSYDTAFNEKTGHKAKAQLIVTRPQIINGGQTAFTLSRIYEQYVLTGNNLSVFDGKEVLLKVITFVRDESKPVSDSDVLKLIEAISKATNQQSAVIEADRRSNDHIQVQLQDHIYRKYGHFYERKRGEFADGLRERYIDRSLVVDRETLMRICKACDLDPANARRMSLDQLFERSHFEKLLQDQSRFDEYFFAYKCYEYLKNLRQKFAKDVNNKYGRATYGQGLQYGGFAVISARKLKGFQDLKLDDVPALVDEVLSKWLEFDEYAIGQGHNVDYFRIFKDPVTGTERQDLNFTNYYKARTLILDLTNFFKDVNGK